MNNLKENNFTNQTQFASESPVFETRTVAESTTTNEKIEKKPFYKTKKGILILVGIILLIVFFILIFLIINNNKNENVVKKVVSEEVLTKEVSPLQQKIDELKIQLSEADPTKQKLSFPPVSLEIGIKEK